MDTKKLSHKECAELRTQEGDKELDRRVIEEQNRIDDLSLLSLIALLIARSIKPDQTDIRLRALRDEIIKRLDK